MHVFGSGRCGWMRLLGLGFTHPVGTRVVLDVCFGCGCVCSEWVGAWTRVCKGWGGVMSV